MNSNSPRGKDRDSAFEGRKPKIRLWLRKLFHVKQFDRELDSELHFHVEAQIETNVRAGMPPEAARQAALREFGGVELAKEECRDERGTRWLEDVWQDVHFGLRMLRKNPGFAAVAVLTLALGIGLSTAIFSFVDAVIIRPLPFPHSGELVTIGQWRLRVGPGNAETGVSALNFLRHRKRKPRFPRGRILPLEAPRSRKGCPAGTVDRGCRINKSS